MRTIEIAVSYTAQVDDATAEAIAKNGKPFCMDIPLSKVKLLKDNAPIAAKFVAYETMNLQPID